MSQDNNAASSQQAAPGAEDVLVFIPGIGPPWDGDVEQGLGDRIAEALERYGKSERSYKAVVAAGKLREPFGGSRVVQVTVQQDGGNASAVADLYVLDLPGLVVEPYRAAGAKSKAKNLVVQSFLFGGRYFRHREHKTRKGRRENLQLIGGGAFLLLMLGGLVLLVPALLTGLILVLAGAGAEAKWLTGATASITAALAVAPKSWREAIDRLSNMILAVASYVTTGTQRDVVTGRLGSFVDRLRERGYKRVHVVAYSLGSIIVLDSIYPRGAQMKSLEGIQTLVTIGCPADFLQLYWPKYFEDRLECKTAPKHWLNVFEPTDLLASNFLKGDTYSETVKGRNKVGEKQDTQDADLTESSIYLVGQETPVRVKNRRYGTQSTQGSFAVLIRAMDVHRTYWNPSNAGASSVFDLVVGRVFDGETQAGTPTAAKV